MSDIINLKRVWKNLSTLLAVSSIIYLQTWHFLVTECPEWYFEQSNKASCVCARFFPGVLEWFLITLREDVQCQSCIKFKWSEKYRKLQK